MDSGKKTINHVEIRKILPVQDGYRMPGEYEPHRGCILIWPERPGSWRNGAREAKKAFADVIRAIAKSEEVYLAASGKTFSEAEKLAQRLQTDEALYPIRVFTAETDDAWARDVGPTFVTDGQEVRGINWEFNAWGGTEDGLYASWEKDNRFAPFFCEKEGYTWYDQGRLCDITMYRSLSTTTTKKKKIEMGGRKIQDKRGRGGGLGKGGGGGNKGGGGGAKKKKKTKGKEKGQKKEKRGGVKGGANIKKGVGWDKKNHPTTQSQSR